MKKLIIIVSITLFPLYAFAGIDLPWSTTYDCAEWTAYSQTLSCDNLGKGLDSTTSGGNQEGIISSANYSGGDGGRGQRHYVGDGVNNNSGGTAITFNTPPSEIWMRWYMRYELGFQWDPLNHDKIMHFDSLTGNQIVVEWQSTDQVRVEAVGQSYASSTGNGWNTVMVNGALDGNGNRKSDGQWHYWEFHLDLSTGTSDIWIDGTLRMHRVGDTYAQSTLQTCLIGGNQRYPANGGDMNVDFDDIAINTTGYIGPLNGTTTTITGVSIH